eukprot:12744546-Prorocentrum_lima.AAC.1
MEPNRLPACEAIWKNRRFMEAGTCSNWHPEPRPWATRGGRTLARPQAQRPCTEPKNAESFVL